MKLKHWLYGVAFALVGWTSYGQYQPKEASIDQNELRLWYENPAPNWLYAVPLGNGRIGAMPDGGITHENIILNDITMWSGSPQNANRPGAVDHLPEIKKLIFAGKNAEAEALVNKYFVCKGAGSGYGNGANVPYGSFQVLGNLHIDYHYAQTGADTLTQNYSRELDLRTAVAKTKFTVNGIQYTREYFTSIADDVIAIRLTADKPGQLSFDLAIDRPERFEVTVKDKELQMYGQLNDGKPNQKTGIRYLTRVRIVHDGGNLKTEAQKLTLTGADSAIIYVSTATSFKDFPYRLKTADWLKTAMQKDYVDLKADHIAAYKKLFDRAELTLENPNQKQAELPTDQRLVAYMKNPTDRGLPVLYFQYGRYLLISSTRPGWLPPNLQGLWAKGVQTPWNGDYHLNINIQMNHWPLEVTNLPMLNEPFLTLVEGMVKPGERTAKVYYGGKGWVAHVITNVWGFTAPGESASWGATNSGSGWMANLLWRHYAFTLDKDYLKRLYPVIKGSAEFYLSTLTEDPRTGWLVTVPSNSPENAFRLKNGKVAHITAGPTIDNQIVRELFQNVITASDILNEDAKLRRQLKRAIKKLPPNQIDEHGRIMEWLKPYEEVEVHHRHVSPLWALYPGRGISVQNTPQLADASKALLERRGDVSTGWSLAWKINLWARLKDGNHCLKLIGDLLRPIGQKGINTSGGGAYPNLFDAHPPFQIDGNFGGTAGIAEMLVQSSAGVVEFLPALPDQWTTGHFEGLRVRGGGEVAAQWDNGQLQLAQLTAVVDNTFTIALTPQQKSRLQLDELTQDVKWDGNNLKVNLKKGEHLQLKFR